MDITNVDRIRHNPHFLELKAKRAQFSWLLTAAVLVIYFGYIAAVAFVPASLATPIYEGSVISIALPLGVFVIVSSVVLTGIYVWRANGEFDRLTHLIVSETLRSEARK